ncbi:MAG: hypothetical protein MRECE_1c104 [Mycoplasmataceae bacterium CE_OT135]|nr:MAG: hypothetical protein MRECE_1c063 [Mycoplasmataceae bacterium CE_OT135]KLL04341.1 MAG: hypothetical protein MRECE_1c104 [Mycoplasmataceae bacterium CE_OT135]
MPNAQQWLDKNYPKEERNEITELDISQKKLKGSLKLEGFVNLVKFTCGENQITQLEINQENPHLVYFDCYDNSLTNLDFLKQLSVPQKLKFLYLSNNNFPEQDLSFLTDFVNLEELYLGNYYRKKKFRQGIYNRFSGSLEILEKMKNLKYLDISNTDIDSGWECLSDGLENIGCLTEEQLDSKVKVIQDALENYKISEDKLGWWKIDIKKAKTDFWKKQSNELQTQVTSLQNQLVNKEQELVKSQQQNVELEAKILENTRFFQDF